MNAEQFLMSLGALSVASLKSKEISERIIEPLKRLH